MTAWTNLPPQTREALDRAVQKEGLDAADLRIVQILCDRAADSGADVNALALVTAALCRACAEGGLCVPFAREALAAALRDLLSAAGTAESDPLPDALAARFLADAEAGRLAAVLGSRTTPRPLLRDGDNLYFHRHAFAEKTVADALRARISEEPPGEENEEHATAVLRNILRETLAENPVELSVRQRWALVAALRERVFVLSGGPGTGKTTWTASWLRALLRMPGVSADRVRLCAPTGRAARRLQESLQKSAGPAARDLAVTTLHTLLGYQPRTGDFARDPDDPLEADWVLVDEASMVDVFLLAALMRALRPNARLILVGDADQLPPVDAGSVLGDLLPEDRAPCLPSATYDALAALFPEDASSLLAARSVAGEALRTPIPSVMLEGSHRARGAVVPLAAAVLAGDIATVLDTLGEPLASGDAAAAFAVDRRTARIAAREPERSGAALTATLHAWSDALHQQRREDGRTFAAWLQAFRVAPLADEPRILELLWKFTLAARVLAPLRHGILSAANANQILRARLEPRWAARGDAPGQGFHGAPILITRNDRGTGLSNGEIGLWLEASGGAAVFFPRPELAGGWLRLPVSQLPAHEPGFAVTVHKSQGSEHDEILLVLPEEGNRLLARETLYTAITRARESVRVFGSTAALREAVSNRLRRHSGLRDRFRQSPDRTTPG